MITIVATTATAGNKRGKYIMTKLLKRREVEVQLSMTGTTIYRLMRQGKFPLPIKFGDSENSAVRWKSDEIQEFIENQPRSNGQSATLSAC